jgi:hypothetical protein
VRHIIFGSQLTIVYEWFGSSQLKVAMMAQMSRKPDVATADQRNLLDVGSFNRPSEDRTPDYMFYPCPGTITARTHGCSCPPARLGAGTVENPYFLDPYCTLHGMRASHEHQRGPRH